MLSTCVKIFILIVFLCLSPYLFAQTPQSNTETYEYIPEEVRPLTIYQNKTDKKMKENGLNKLQNKGLKEGNVFSKKYTQQLQNLEHDKDAVKFVKKHNELIRNMYRTTANKMGLNDSTTKLYYFVSFSMPDALIKAYMHDAMWNEGTLVLRGIKKGMTLSQFLQKYLLPLVQHKGSHAKIIINPNLYEEYDINVVPTILIAHTNHDKKGCDIVEDKKKFSLSPSCLKADPKTYWKISGNLSSMWALEALQNVGAPANRFITLLKQKNKSVVHKTENGFEGDWKNAKQPISDSDISNLLKKFGLDQNNTGVITQNET